MASRHNQRKPETSDPPSLPNIGDDAAPAARLEAIFNAIADGIYVYDRDGRLIQTNTSARELNPQTQRDAYLERSVDERIAAIDVRDEQGRPLTLAASPVMRVLRGEVLTGTNAADTVMRMPDGRELLLNTTGAPVRDETGQITGAVVVTRDMTNRRRLEQRTHEALAALLAMAQTLVRAPGTKTSDSERIVAHRLAGLACSVLGCTRVAIQAVEPGTQVLRPVAVVGLSPEQDQQWWDEQLQQPQRLGDGVDPKQFSRFLSGEIFTLDMTQPPFDALPNPYGISTIMIAPMRVGEQVVGALSLDHSGEPHQYTPQEIQLAGAVAQLAALVIQREQLQRERAAAEARALALEETNQLMHEFMGIAGHELRTPLTSAKANVQLAERLLHRLLDNPTPQEDVPHTLTRLATLLNRTDRQMRRQERLVNDLLDVSRIQAGQLELHPREMDLAAILHDAVDEQRALHPERTITLDIPASEARTLIMADPDRVQQVVINYLGNALKYSPPDSPVSASLRREGDAVRVSVHDEGSGLPPEEHEHVWEAFHQAPGVEVLSGSGIGLGLGLHISRTIVERHGGHVGVESAPGRGSMFWFTLPLRQTTGNIPSPRDT